MLLSRLVDVLVCRTACAELVEGTSPDCSMSQSNRRKVGLPVSDAMISRLLEPNEFEFGIHLSR